MSASLLSALCALLPALATDIAAGLIGQLLAAVPRLRQDQDPASADLALVRELAELHPRDMQEAMLAVQQLAAHHHAILCMQAAMQLDIASKEASRLRRDAAMQQRVMATLQRALRQSQARRMPTDAATGEAPVAEPQAEPRPAVTRRRSAAPAIPAAPEDTAEASKPFPRPDLFDNHPDLKQLNDRWHSLPRWEDMSMEERRQTWGYKPEPVAAPDGGGPAAG